MADWTLHASPDGSWRVSAAVDERVVRFRADAVLDDSGRTWVHLDGVVVVVDAPDAPRPRHAQGTASLDAPMPAQVTAVLVAPGDSVESGAVLVLLEAMKMELPLRAPAPGVVRGIHCAPGDRVAPGRALVDIEPQVQP